MEILLSICLEDEEAVLEFLTDEDNLAMPDKIGTHPGHLSPATFACLFWQTSRDSSRHAVKDLREHITDFLEGLRKQQAMEIGLCHIFDSIKKDSHMRVNPSKRFF
jgi:hypothetical protein